MRYVKEGLRAFLFLLSASEGGWGERLSPDEAQSGGASFEGLRERAPKDFPLSDKLPVDSAKVALGEKLVSDKRLSDMDIPQGGRELIVSFLLALTGEWNGKTAGGTSV